MICRPETRLFGALGLAILTLGGCEDAGGDLPPIESARVELARGNPLAAEILLEHALDEGAARQDVAALFGEAELQEGDLRAAREWLGPGEFSDDTRAFGFQLLGRLEMREGRLAQAGAAFDRSYRVDPDSSQLWVDIGRLRYLGGEQIQAVEAADRALELDPENGHALVFRGQLARDAQGLASGAAKLSRALELIPDDAELRVEYAATLVDAGRAAEGLAVLRAGVGEVTAVPRGFYVQAIVAARGGNFSLARDLLNRSGMVQEGVPAALLLSAIADLEEQNYASAAQTLARLHSRQPDNRRVRDLFALALSQSGGERELVYRFANYARGGSGSTYLRALVGRAYEALDQRERAAVFLDSAAAGGSNLAVLPSMTPPETLAVAKGVSGLDTRDYVRSAIARREAMAAVRRARDFARRFPGSGDAFAILGDAQFAQGNKRAAREAYERAAQVRRPWPLALRLTGTQDNRDTARQLLEAYVRENPMNGEAAAMLADALAAQEEWERAALLLEHAMGLGMERVPWVLAARSVAAVQLDDAETALAFALAAHELQPMNPLAIASLLAVLPEEEAAARAELAAKLRSLTD